jgi:hypothetical protein
VFDDEAGDGDDATELDSAGDWASLPVPGFGSFGLSPFGSLYTSLSYWGGPFVRAFVDGQPPPTPNHTLAFSVAVHSVSDDEQDDEEEEDAQHKAAQPAVAAAAAAAAADSGAGVAPPAPKIDMPGTLALPKRHPPQVTAHEVRSVESERRARIAACIQARFVLYSSSVLRSTSVLIPVAATARLPTVSPRCRCPSPTCWRPCCCA